jgi:hypothetical protein
VASNGTPEWQPIVNSLGVLTALIIGVATMLAQARNAKRQLAADAEKQRAANENQVLIERLKLESAERIKAEDSRTVFIQNILDRLRMVEESQAHLQGELAARREEVQQAKSDLLDERQKKHDALGELHAQGLKHEHDMHEQKECFEKDMYELKLKHAEEIAVLRGELDRHRAEIEKLRGDIAQLRDDSHAA